MPQRYVQMAHAQLQRDHLLLLSERPGLVTTNRLNRFLWEPGSNLPRSEMADILCNDCTRRAHGHHNHVEGTEWLRRSDHMEVDFRLSKLPQTHKAERHEPKSPL